VTERRAVSVSHLHPNPWNPNRMDEATFQAELASIREFGFVDPVTVRPHPTRRGHFEIIDGEHRWRAAKALALTVVDVVVLDATDAQAKRLTVILNETRGSANPADLGKLLADLQRSMSVDELVRGMPYTRTEVEDLIGLSSFDWDAYKANPLKPEVTQPQEDAWVELNVTLPEAVYERLVEVRADVERRLVEAGGKLDARAARAWGQVIEAVLAIQDKE
jgi:ParB/RepB/Spo0J family partition protein